jgi:dTMP kinase
MFVVLEGLDKCGKTTVALRLAAERHAQIRYIKFPYYDCITGRAIKEAFAKGLARPSLNALFAANRLEMKGTIQQWLAQGKLVLADRYSYSGWAYSEAEDQASMDWVIGLDDQAVRPQMIFLFTERVAALSQAEMHETVETQSRVRATWAKLWDTGLITSRQDIWEGIERHKVAAGSLEANYNFVKEKIEKYF